MRGRYVSRGGDRPTRNLGGADRRADHSPAARLRSQRRALRGRRRKNRRSAALRARHVRRVTIRLMNPYLEEAFELAARGSGRVSPNPAVGAVIVREGQAIGRGFYTAAGVKHAEILALEEAGDRARGADMYVTLEPHSFQGRAPPCTDAIIGAGIRRVISPVEDPNPQVRRRGFPQLRSARVGGEMAPENSARAHALNQAFDHFMRTGRPLVTLKAAVTPDGKIPAPEDVASGGTQGRITREQARA